MLRFTALCCLCHAVFLGFVPLNGIDDKNVHIRLTMLLSLTLLEMSQPFSLCLFLMAVSHGSLQVCVRADTVVSMEVDRSSIYIKS